MTHRRMAIAFVCALIGVALTLAACGGEDEETTTSQAPAVGPPAGVAPPSGGGAVFADPEFVKCMADRGFPIASPEDIHSASPEALEACFGSVH